MDSELERDPYKLVGGSLKQYRILTLAEIGERGLIYRAQHEVTGVVVAIKVLRADLTFGEFGDQEGLNYFFKSVAKLTSLSHSSLIQIYEADLTDDGLVYVVMEWAEGRTLKQELEERGVFSIGLSTLLCERVCDAMAYAHANGVVHRDFNANDIMLIRQEGRETLVRIRNFGMAKALSKLMHVSSLVAGRRCDISPDETATTRQMDQNADLHSLGSVLYQMLSGHLPCDIDGRGRLDPEIRWAPKPLRHYCPDLPETVETVILRAISDKPTHQYQTAGELANALRNAVSSASGEIILQCVDAQNGAIVSGAKVYLNGQASGEIDAEGLWRQKNLSARTYLVEVELDRYLRWHRSTTLRAGGQATLLAEMERERKGGLYIYCGVAEASVEIDGTVVGQTDSAGRFTLDSIRVGSHTVRLSHKRYVSAEKTIEVMAWEQTALDLQLEERSARKKPEETLKKIKSAFDPLREVGKILPKKSPNSAPPPPSENSNSSREFRLGPEHRQTPEFRQTPEIKQGPDLKQTPEIRQTPEFKQGSELKQGNDSRPEMSPPLKRKPPPPPAPPLPTRPAEQSCTACSTIIPPQSLFCPKCGTIRAGGKSMMSGGNRPFNAAKKEAFIKSMALASAPGFEEPKSLTSTQQRQAAQEAIELSGLLKPSASSKGSSGAQDRWLFLFVGGVVLIAIFFMSIMVQRAYVKAPTYSLELASLPPNTRVTINGKNQRIADSAGRVSFEGLDKGPHALKASREGFRELERMITLPLTGADAQISLERIIPEDMVYIPGGSLMMGGGPASKENAAGPAHTEQVSPYFMGKHETTREKYKKFIEATGRTAPPGWTGTNFPEGTAQWPVTGVSWNDASGYCQWEGGRLPTEEEWEFAARGTDGRLYPWGGGEEAFAFDKANVGRETGALLPVGSFPSGVSPFGVFDMAGNAWEWTDNNFLPYPGSPYKLANCNRCKTLRGGAYINQPEYATAIFRQPYEAALIAPPNEYYGFRCARSAILP